MSIREKLNQNGTLTTLGAVAIVVLAVVVVVWQLGSRGSPEPKGLYFSSDDGSSYFVQDLNSVPPITKGGKEAVQAMVFKCGWGKPFVAYLQRYTPEAKKRYEESIANNTGLSPAAIIPGRQVKRPGDKEWISSSDPQYTPIINVQCPSGKIDDLKTVWP